MKILFICNRIPNNENAGGILYHDIMKTYGIEKFKIISVSQKLQDSKFLHEYDHSNIKQFSLRISSSNVFLKVLKKLPIIEPLYLFIKLNKVKKDVFKIIENEKFDSVFAPLRGDVLFILNDILMKTNLPLISMIEDTVEREIDDHPILYRRKKKLYYEAISKVKTLGVPGETMHMYIQDNFHLKSTIVRPSYKFFPEIKQKTIIKDFNIFFSGNLYAKNEAQTFIKALILFAERNEELNIIMYVASHIKLYSNSEKIQIKNLGWVDEKVLQKCMEICHISYLPYKFDKKFSHSMKYAFPGKAGFYISNNLPIFFHGPEYSSFNTFLEQYCVGISCGTLVKIEIVKKLEIFILDPKFYKECLRQCENSFHKEFTTDVFTERINNLFKYEK
jgi:glycosyltransferase involved in cell wall biosynthesis